MKLPNKIFAQHIVVLGKTGSGKSSALRFMVESHLMARGKRVCVIDPKGDWWGVKVAAENPGLPFVLFGDFKNDKASDVPINERSGKTIASLIAGGNRPCVIGLRGWTQGAMTRFWIDFASTLFAKNAGELYLIGDEFHNFAPKQWKGQADKDTPVGIGLHWANRLLSEGRGLGLVCLIASQRPQKVHNDTLTSCETLVAMRVIHAADRAAVKAWIDGNGDPAVAGEVLDSLAGMPRGDAWIWSPEIDFGPKRLTFPMFGTFDSFAPPQTQKRVSSKSWADVNLSEVKTALEVEVKEAKANDPAELRRQIVELKKQKPQAAASVSEKQLNDIRAKAVAERDRYWNAEVARIVKGHNSLAGKMTKIHQMSALNGEATLQVATPPKVFTSKVTKSEPAPQKSFTKKVKETGDFGRCERAILQVLSQYPEGCDSGKLTLLTGYRYSGGFKNALSALRQAGLIQGENTGVMTITDAGAASEEFEPLPTGAALRSYWLNHRSFGKCERAILAELIDAPSGMTAEELCDVTGYQYSGGFKNALSSLRTAGVIEGRNTETMKPSPILFE